MRPLLYISILVLALYSSCRKDVTAENYLEHYSREIKENGGRIIYFGNSDNSTGIWGRNFSDTIAIVDYPAGCLSPGTVLNSEFQSGLIGSHLSKYFSLTSENGEKPGVPIKIRMKYFPFLPSSVVASTTVKTFAMCTDPYYDFENNLKLYRVKKDAGEFKDMNIPSLEQVTGYKVDTVLNLIEFEVSDLDYAYVCACFMNVDLEQYNLKITGAKNLTTTKNKSTYDLGFYYSKPLKMYRALLYEENWPFYYLDIRFKEMKSGIAEASGVEVRLYGTYASTLFNSPKFLNGYSEIFRETDSTELNITIPAAPKQNLSGTLKGPLLEPNTGKKVNVDLSFKVTRTQ